MASFEDVFSTCDKKNSVKKHPNVNFKWIHYKDLIRSAYQIYSEADEVVRKQADIIEVDQGVLQSLLVRQVDVGKYELIAGHKRTLACKLLVEEGGKEEYAFLPCFILGCNDVVARYRVMSTNMRYEKTPYEVMREIEDMKYIIENHAEDLGLTDSELKGRMVERLARQMQMGRSKVSDYLTISHNLGEEGMKAFEEGELDKSAALALASFPEEKQEELLKKGVTRHKELIKHKKNVRSDKKDKDPAGVAEQDTVAAVETEKTSTVSSLNYKEWNIWTRNELTEEIFYRLECDDETAVVVRNYPYLNQRGKATEGAEYYLLKPGYVHFKDCETDEETVINYLNNWRGNP